MDREVCLTIVLALWAIQDIRKNKIKLWPMPILALWQLMFLSGQEVNIWFDSFCGMAVGIAFCVISLLLPGVIGLGDGWVIALLGFYIGLPRLLPALGIAFFLAGITAAIYILLKKGKTARLSFIPYIYVGYMMMWNCFR